MQYRPDIAANLTANEVYDYFVNNFKRYNNTRTPFGIYQHIYWFGNNKAILEGFTNFLDYLTSLDYVYIVTVSKVFIICNVEIIISHFIKFFHV